jgi:hypothetical protein
MWCPSAIGQRLWHVDEKHLLKFCCFFFNFFEI